MINFTTALVLITVSMAVIGYIWHIHDRKLCCRRSYETGVSITLEFIKEEHDKQIIKNHEMADKLDDYYSSMAEEAFNENL